MTPNRPSHRSTARRSVAVAATALAVTGVAAGAWALQPDDEPALRLAAPAASATTGPASGGDGYALDPARPWPLRGDGALLSDGTRDAFAREWAVRRGVDEATTTFTPLLVQEHEPSAAVEAVYVARSGTGPWYWGVVTTSEGGPHFHQDARLADGTAALSATLPGDEGVERLLVVAAPSTGGAVYAEDGRDFRPMADVLPGAFVTPVEDDRPADRWKVLDGDGYLDRVVAEGDAPRYANAG